MHLEAYNGMNPEALPSSTGTGTSKACIVLDRSKCVIYRSSFLTCSPDLHVVHDKACNELVVSTLPSMYQWLVQELQLESAFQACGILHATCSVDAHLLTRGLELTGLGSVACDRDQKCCRNL